MANTIPITGTLTAINLPGANEVQYHLPEAHRQSIIAKSDYSLKREEIERQRLRFTQLNGADFLHEFEES